MSIAFTTESVIRERDSGEKAVAGGEKGAAGAEVCRDSWASSTQEGSHKTSLLPF